jgi:hypothetical protein
MNHFSNTPPPLGRRKQRSLLTLLEDGGGTAVLGQLAHVELFLLGETALVELHRQDQPDQSRRQKLPPNGRDGEKSAPAAEEKRDSEEHQAQNQRGPGDLFGTFGRHCHWRSSSRKRSIKCEPNTCLRSIMSVPIRPFTD